ncbi:MAG: exopolysaccharide biosynthesis polyprenyl glycosylphosphotransferase [Candidatus Omnitrophica bacterium]|nr:exopolysaccharide biosynthesis polyprenyl glycosylphosphotransferase [Candidatus Omnitrophota bacterium]
MNETTYKSFSELMGEVKEELALYFFYRRYQKTMEGKMPWEEVLLTNAVKFYTQIVIRWRSLAKRIIDLAASLFGLAASLPVMVLVALAIKLDTPGPVFFGQVRVGKKGKPFVMLKFRTMYSDAETLTGPVWATERDPRITRVGMFLRRTHLDELPQLINVFRGEMSLVGPRPERPYFVREFRKIIPHYDRRLCVKPGITGLAQVRQGYDRTIADVKRKVKYDFLYIEKMCPLLDVKVLAMTVGAVFGLRGQ